MCGSSLCGITDMPLMFDDVDEDDEDDEDAW